MRSVCLLRWRAASDECSERDPVACLPVNAGRVLDRAVKALKASPSLDHWQRGRERIEAEDLLEHVVGEELDRDDDVSQKQRRRFEALVDRRVEGEPIPYIKGYSEFLGLELLARPGVFVPRDSSEWLATQAIRRLSRRRKPIAIDLATGGGTIAIAIADRVPKAKVYGSDLSEDAVALARKNAKRLSVSASFLAGDLFDGLPKKIAGRVPANAAAAARNGVDWYQRAMSAGSCR